MTNPLRREMASTQVSQWFTQEQTINMPSRKGPIVATGGTKTVDGLYTIHTFTATGNFIVTSGSGQIGWLVIGGGGGGGGSNGNASRAGGGGGGGAIIFSRIGDIVGGGEYSPTVRAGDNLYVTVGGGGPGYSGLAKGDLGYSTVISSVATSTGGGAGGSGTADGGDAVNAGGAGHASFRGIFFSPAGVLYWSAGDGGNGYDSGNALGNFGGGGGSGGQTTGGNASVTTGSGSGGNGAAGIAINTVLTVLPSLTTIISAGGGGGAQDNANNSLSYVAGTGGSSNTGGRGGAGGSFQAAPQAAGDGVANTGSGGGGAGTNDGVLGKGGNGGSGRAIIYYLTR